ncbi:hypothetical protein [Actinomadura sp. NPDC049753]|uniref:hypothetical protein n=1 Tax=Actinomadura sp. NPDC049753 TaxID=3154739 RepID=UPI0034433390
MVFATATPLSAQEKTQVTLPETTLQAISNILAPHSGLRMAYPLQLNRTNGRMLTRLRVDLEGRRENSLLIKEIKARIIRRAPPLAGAFVNGPPQGDGDVVQLGFDLDSSDLSARETTVQGEFRGRYIDSKFITLQRGEQIPINVVAATAKYYCEWVIEVTVWTNGRDQKMTIDDDGRPFRSTALANRYRQEFWFQASRFIEIPPKNRVGQR